MTAVIESDLGIAFVGSVMSEVRCQDNPVCNPAGNKFQRNFLYSLLRAGRCALDVITFVPAAMFPRGSRLVYGSEMVEIDPDMAKAEAIRFVNVPILKQLSQAISIFLALRKWHRSQRGRRRVVIVYNVFAPHALPVLAARALYGGKAIALVADLPHGIYQFAGIRGLFERLDMSAQTRSLAHFDGQIVLTEMIAADFAPGVPSLIVEGAADGEQASLATTTEPPPDVRTILFSGTLNEINGTVLMLQAFAELADPRYRLRIFGRGPLQEMVVAAAARDSRIQFEGFQPNELIMRHQSEATVLINPRPIGHPITRYSFPSKLFEYMLSGRPVITTRLAGITPDYHPHLYLLDEETPQGLARKIEEVCDRPAQELSAKGRGAREFVLENKTWQQQGQRVYSFVSRIAAKGAEC